MPPTKQPAEPQVYQLKITLLGSKPPIWRRFQVPSDINLAKLHRIIQEVMGWEDSHLHQFKVGKTYYGMSYPDDFDEVTRTKDEKDATVSALVSKPKAKILPPEPGVRYPVCITGKRACPPEDCGGVWGYADLLEAMQNPKHPEHDDMQEWIGGSFDPEAFDVEAVNKALRRIR